MKLTKDVLKKIIKEELEEMVATEAYTSDSIRQGLMDILNDFESRSEPRLRKEEVVEKIKFILNNYKE